MSKVRVVVLSDTHNMHRYVEVPEGDILIHAGDICQSLGQRASRRAFQNRKTLTDFNAWLGTLPHKHKVVIAGNHEFLCQENREEAERILSNAIYLQDSGVRLGGLYFWGSPWQPEYGGWAFNLPTGAPLQKKWEQIPDHTDVLITHGPPRGILDCNGYLECGCDDLLKAVERVKPALHVFGHIHAAAGSLLQEGTQFINAALVDEDYNIVHAPTVWEYEAQRGDK